MLQLFVYFLFAAILLSAFGVILSKNPIQSVLLLVLLFILTALLFIVFGAEFLAVLLITVYVGAIAILFLFVVMMLNLRIVELYGSIYYHVPIGAFIGLLFSGLLFYIVTKDVGGFSLYYENSYNYTTAWLSLLSFESNLHSIGEVFYNYYLEYFFLVSLILFVAMVGVIVLAVDYDYRPLHYKSEIKATERQSAYNLRWSNMAIYIGKELSPPTIPESSEIIFWWEKYLEGK